MAARDANIADDFADADNLTIRDGIRKLAKMQGLGKDNQQLPEEGVGTSEYYGEEQEEKEEAYFESCLQHYDTGIYEADEFEDFTEKKLKKPKENDVEINPELPIEEYIQQTGRNSEKEFLSLKETKSIGFNNNGQAGNDYIMRKIEELSSQQNRAFSKSNLESSRPDNHQSKIGSQQGSINAKRTSGQSTNRPPNSPQTSKPHSTEIDMSDNIFLLHKNPELVKRRQEELLMQRQSTQAIEEDLDDDEQALKDIE